MSLLLRPSKLSITRNRTGMTALVKRAPAGQYALDYWLAWIAANWG
jgi:hypothetical protein